MAPGDLILEGRFCRLSKGLTLHALVSESTENLCPGRQQVQKDAFRQIDPAAFEQNGLHRAGAGGTRPSSESVLNVLTMPQIFISSLGATVGIFT